MTYRKVGGLHFVTLGGIGFTFYRRRKVAAEGGRWMAAERLAADALVGLLVVVTVLTFA